MEEIAIQTVIEMITQRGYEVIKEDDNTIIVQKKKKKICLFKNIVGKCNTEHIKICLAYMNKIDVNHCILIYSTMLTSMAKKLIHQASETLEVFTMEELQYNITKHRLVPKHVGLSPKNSKIFKEKYGNKFPAMLKSDPVSRFYNYPRGTVVKVIRLDGYIAYRIVK